MTEARADFLTRLKPKGDRAMSRKPVSFALPVEVDEWVRSLPNRSEWLREAIIEKYEKQKRESLDEENKLSGVHRKDNRDKQDS